jgi:DNA-binding response OmpR family regulator
MTHILLVEDHADIRRLVRMTLEFEPCTIDEAGCATDAWELAHARRPDLVLLDVMMPGPLDGRDLCRALKADPRLGDVPVVMLSACGSAAEREAGRAAGADDYLVKPFSPMQLLELLSRRVLRGHVAPAAAAAGAVR